MYGLTEKILMLFPFYRERVRVMDAYALRLSEAVDALKVEAECHTATISKLAQAQEELEATKAELEASIAAVNDPLVWLSTQLRKKNAQEAARIISDTLKGATP